MFTYYFVTAFALTSLQPFPKSGFGSYFVTTFAPLFLKVDFGSYFVTTFALTSL